MDDAIDAAQAALAALRAMPGSQERVDAAGRLARELRTLSTEATSVLREEAWRIRDEEKLLRNELDGYREYAQKVRYRLVPAMW